MKTTPQEERNGLNPCDCGESPVHSVNGHKIGGFKGNTPQEEWKDVLYKFTLGSLHLSLEKRHDWYKSFIKSEKEKSVEETFLDIANNPSKIREFWKREARQEVLREVREKIEKRKSYFDSKTKQAQTGKDEHSKKLVVRWSAKREAFVEVVDLLSTLESKE